MARIDFDVEGWNEVGPGTGVLAWVVVPRLLDGSAERRQSSRSG
jgi:hypothetical protein